MCGIAGIYNADQDCHGLEALGWRMTELLAHRGPDDRGVETYELPNGRSLMLAHTRLSIVDLSEAGHQPMISSGGELTIVFNGEIYNFRELRRELESKGARFKSQTDTEMVLEAYREWGIECFDRFNGMWALAIWDQRRNQLLLSRDRLGIKPLYYAQDGDVFLFSSEPKGILAGERIGRRINLEGLSDYLSYRYVLGSESLFDGIQSLEPGCHLVIKNGDVRQVRYWDLPILPEKEDPGEDAATATVAELLESAVSLRMQADVPVGAFLSGGLDSSAIVAIMAGMSNAPVKTFTIGFPEDEGVSEFSYAQQVADQFGTDHSEVLLRGQDLLALVPELINKRDAPLTVSHEVALYALSKALKKDITVVLSGEGADELFGGYGRIFRSAWDYQRMKQLENGLGGGSDSCLKENLLKKYVDLQPRDEVSHFLGQYSYTSLEQKNAVLSSSAQSALGPDRLNSRFFESHMKRLSGLDLHEKFMWLFQKFHLLGLLGRLDIATMATSVEGRVPFVDHRLVEYVNRLPLKYKLRWRSKADESQAALLNSDQTSEVHDIPKYLLKKISAAKHLPEDVISRRKVGFPVPLNRWLTKEFGEMAQDLLLSSDASTRPLFNQPTITKWLHDKDSGTNSNLAQSIWMLVNVELWMRQYQVQV